MPIRDSLARLLGVKASIVPLEASELPDRALEKAFDDATLLSTFGDDAWPYILANKIGEQASQAPLQVGKVIRSKSGEEDFEPVGPGHPVQMLLDAPNPLYDGSEFTHLLLLYMELVGHVPLEVVKPGPGAVLGAPGRRGLRARSGFELWLHNPGPWRIVANPDATIRGYLWVRANESDVRWEPDQMTYLRWPNPADRWYGQGRLQAVRQQVMAEEYAAIRDKKYEKNLGIPPGILSTEMPLGDPQAAELQRRWERAVGGYSNAGKIAVLGSKTSYQAVQQSARDAQWLDQRHDRVEIMAAAFGVPLPLVRMQDAKFANAQEARAEFWEGTLAPRLTRVARMLTHRLLPLLTSEPLEVRYNLAGIEALGENDLTAAQTAKAWSDTGSVTVDEVRRRLGLPPMEGDAGSRIIVPTTLGLKTTDELSAPPPVAPAPVPPPAPTRSRKADDGITAAPLVDVHGPLVDAYGRDLAAFFTAQRDALHGAVPKGAPSDEIEAIAERILAVLNAQRWRDRLLRISEGPIASAMTAGAVDAAGTLGVSVSWAIPASEDALAYLTTHLNALGVGIANTTNEQVRAVLDATLRAGAKNAETRAALDKLFDGYADWRKDRISRTETRAAYNLGGLKQYAQSGVTMVYVVDGDQDNACVEAQNGGNPVPLIEAEGNPLGHPNCRRTFIPVTDHLGRRSGEPEASKDGMVTIRLPAAPDIRVPAPVVNVAPPVVHVAPPVVNVAAAPAPVVNVAAPDLAPIAKSIAALRGDMADLRAEVRKPRTKTLVRDDLGRIVGSKEE